MFSLRKVVEASPSCDSSTTEFVVELDGTLNCRADMFRIDRFFLLALFFVPKAFYKHAFSVAGAFDAARLRVRGLRGIVLVGNLYRH